MINWVFWITVILWIIPLGVVISSIVVLFKEISDKNIIKINPIFQGLIIGIIFWAGQNILDIIFKSFQAYKSVL